MAGETHRIRVLHISDLHAGKEPVAIHGWQMRRVLGDSWKRNIDEILDDGRAVDLVCFTGDLAWSGQEAQYDDVTAFLSSLLERL